MGNYVPGLNFPIYSGWGQYTPVIPKLYWDVYSQEQRLKQLCMNFDKVEHYLDYVAKLMNSWNMEFTEEIETELAKMWDEVHSGYKDAIKYWFENDFFREVANQVFFGLTLDGHFVAYIPESWNDIVFDTGQDYSLDTYGRLILRYNVNGSKVLQIPEAVRDTPEYHELYTYIYNMMNTLYSPEDE